MRHHAGCLGSAAAASSFQLMTHGQGLDGLLLGELVMALTKSVQVIGNIVNV